MNLNLKPLRDNIIVKLIEMAEATPGGVLIPEIARGRSQEALVLAVGPGQWRGGKRVAVDLDMGDRVLLAEYAGTQVEWGDGKIIVVKSSDVLATVSYDGEDK